MSAWKLTTAAGVSPRGSRTYLLSMEHAARSLAPARSRLAARADLPAAGAWLLTFAPVLYLGLRGGGYDAVVRGEVGLAVWWLLAIGALAGLLPVARPGRATLALLGAFALFTVWTGLGIAWADSAERGFAELARVAAYLGMLGLAAWALDARTARSALHGAAVACGAIGLLAVLSRVHPSWFPDNDLVTFFGAGAGQRLVYPLNYADAVGSFMAIGIPVLLAAAASARTIAGKAVSAGAVPVLVLAIYLSGSRGGLLAVVVGVLVWIALAPDRLPRLGTLGFAGLGSAVLLAATAERDGFRAGLSTAAASDEANQMLVYLVVVCAGVALLQGGMALALRYDARPAWSRPSRSTGLLILTAVVFLGVGTAVTVGAPGALSDKLSEFRSADAPSNAPGSDVFGRLADLSGSNRYQYWQSAVRGFETDRLKGIGPGGFELWWARDGEISEFVRDAHSLYVETLAELGIVGLALLAVALALMLGAGAAGALRRGPQPQRLVAAGATAGVAAFAAGASVNWNWEISVLPMLALLLAGVALAARRGEDARPQAPARRPWSRAAVGLTALAAIVLIAIPLAATRALRGSEAEARGGDLAAALASADQARRLQPYASTPQLQRALVLELAGSLDGAATSVSEAIRSSPQDWRLWLVRSRVQAKRGKAAASVADYRRARTLNPRSSIFAR